MRKQPSSSPPAVTPKQLDAVITQVREYELITPLYGGGVNPNKADPITVVRATEIRGQLRFWWRACRGGQKRFNSDLAAMKKEEDSIWGAAYKKGDPIIPQEQTIQIIVEPLKQGTAVKPFRIEKDKKQNNQSKPVPDIPAYAAFPLQPDQDELKKTEPYIPDVRNRVSFTLTISFPENKRTDVEAALWAWETFGGIGARTRRGFGALRLLKIDGMNHVDLPYSDIVKVKSWVEAKVKKFVEPGKPPADVPYLSSSSQFVVTPSSESAVQAWKRLIDKLYRFRQDGRPGRSNWPEAEAIRMLTTRRDSRYEELSHPQKFPRAAFGLPIIFHFKDPQDPKDTTLREGEEENGEKKDRFTSPLILRPFMCRDNRAVGVALLLEGSRVDLEKIVLVDEDKLPHPVEARLTKDEAENIAILNGETDVLKAFMNFLP